jgi:hypothetical protein
VEEGKKWKSGRMEEGNSEYRSQESEFRSSEPRTLDIELQTPAKPRTLNGEQRTANAVLKLALAASNLPS